MPPSFAFSTRSYSHVEALRAQETPAALRNMDLDVPGNKLCLASRSAAPSLPRLPLQRRAKQEAKLQR